MKWGQITWIFLHSLSIQIRPEHYLMIKVSLFEHIKTLCSCLPCPECASHATNYIKHFPVPNTKEDFCKFFNNFHNMVNSRLRKPIEGIEKLEKYKTTNLTQIFHLYKNITLNQPYNPKLAMTKVNAIRFFKKFHLYLGKNSLIKY